MRKLLFIGIIFLCLTGCAEFMERLSAVMSPQEKANDYVSQISKEMKDYYESLLGNKSVNSNLSYRDFLLALQQQAREDGLQVRKPGVDNMDFNILAIWALEQNINKIREELKEYYLLRNNPYYQNLETLYETMTKVRYDICMFSLNKGRDTLFENGAYCHSAYTLTQEEIKALFVNPDRNFVIKWGCVDPDSGHIPDDKKETIFDMTYLLFAN